MSFSRRPDPRDKMLSLRVTTQEKDRLESIARQLDCRGTSEVLRLALDYWIENGLPDRPGSGRKRRM